MTAATSINDARAAARDLTAALCAAAEALSTIGAALDRLAATRPPTDGVPSLPPSHLPGPTGPAFSPGPARALADELAAMPPEDRAGHVLCHMAGVAPTYSWREVHDANGNPIGQQITLYGVTGDGGDLGLAIDDWIAEALNHAFAADAEGSG